MSLSKIDFTTIDYEYYKVPNTDPLDDDFKSEIQEFTDYYHRDSLQDIREKLVQMYVLKIEGKVMGYVTLAMTHIRNDVTEAIKEKDVNGTIPALLISHLAVRAGHNRRGIGHELLDMIFSRLVPKLKKFAGCRYVMLNPRDDAGVRKFYDDYGFDYAENAMNDKESDAFLYDVIDIPDEED